MDIRRYDIVSADLSGAIGSEQGGIRPVVVVQNDVGNVHSPTTIVIPLTKKIKNLSMPTHALIRKTEDTGLKQDSMLLGEQVRIISNQRIIGKIGYVSDEKEKEEIRRAYFANFGE